MPKKSQINEYSDPTNGMKRTSLDPRGWQNFITSQMRMFGGYLKVREFVYTWVVIELTAILNHIICVCTTVGLVYIYMYSWMHAIDKSTPTNGMKKTSLDPRG